MILINSAAYVNAEFRNEFGSIPPCFLPIGNKKLLSHQVNALRKQFSQKIIVSLPSNYALSIDESLLLQELDVEPIFVQEGISLGMALLYILNTIGYENETLRLLHGDTLLGHFPEGIDCIGLGKPQDDYIWQVNEGSSAVWCGFFAFSSPKSFVRALALSQGDFANAVKTYKEEKGIAYENVDLWYDFGHINTYFQSRSIITTQRAFNSLKIENGVVWKSGTPPRKIEAEANWFQQLPAELKRFTPQLIQSGKTEQGNPFYETEYLPILPLNEIFVHGRNPVAFWEKVLGLISFYMNESRKYFSYDDKELIAKIHQDSTALYADKTYERLEAYAKQKSIDLDKPARYNGKNLPSLRQIAQECIDASLALPEVPAVVHGDLCFSNVMYDSRSNSVKVIDPRGLNIQQELTIYGNQSYDLAKLCHSFIGLYDFIIADAFHLEKNDEIGVKLRFNLDSRLKQVQSMFMQKSLIPELSNKAIIAPTILLFLSMIPLHFDKPHRQEAMLANALRLYVEYFKA